MSFAAPPGVRLSGSSCLVSDPYLGFGPVLGCQKKTVTLYVKGRGCGSSPNVVRRLHFKESCCVVSVRLHASGVCSGNSGNSFITTPGKPPGVVVTPLSNRTRNSVIRGEMGAPLEEELGAGELVSPEVEFSQGRGEISSGKDLDASDMITPLRHVNGNGDWDSCDGSGGGREFPPGGGGGGGDGGDVHSENNGEEDEFGPILKFEEIMKETEARAVNLPSDMYEAAKTLGIRKVFLDNYLNMQELAWPLGAAIRWCPLLRNRMLADRQFLFKIGTEIVIDSCCATFAEVKKRGKDFWAEFELYAADLLVGLVVNVALVALLAPYARIGQPSTSKGLFSRMARLYGDLPSSVFEAERPGCRFSVQQRIGTYFYKGVLYGPVGFVCGLVGQGIANMIMTAKRRVKKSEEDVPVPPLVKSAALWGVFLAISSNTRYQIVNGLERIVESSPLAKRVPPLAMAFTVGVRFANNIYGGMQFVDWARWSGCQ